MWRDGDKTSWNSYFTSFGGQQSNGRVASINTPQKEELPNITGKFGGAILHWNENKNYEYSSLFEIFTAQNRRPKFEEGTGSGFNFDAAKANNIYSGAHVIPANYSVYAYIYAGKVVEK